MAPARDVHVEIGGDYLLSLPDGGLYLWGRSDAQRIVPANEAARRAAGSPSRVPPRSIVQIFVIESAGRIALACSAAELSDDARTQVRAVLARELPDASPVFCSHEGQGVATAESAPHDGAIAPEAEEIAACVAVMKASAGWDETAVMVIEADGVRCTVEMWVGKDVRDVRVSSAR